MQSQLQRINLWPKTKQPIYFQLIAPGAFQAIEVGKKADDDARKKHNFVVQRITQYEAQDFAPMAVPKMFKAFFGMRGLAIGGGLTRI